jgi:hypothetical protein
MVSERVKRRIRAYMGPKSKCTCGHMGDGTHSSHCGIMGHGACTIYGCPCKQFTWDSWTSDFERYLELAQIDEEQQNLIVDLP